MATFTINLSFSFVNGTAANDTFNISTIPFVTAFGLDGDDQFSVAGGRHSLDGGAGNDSFSLPDFVEASLVFGGDGNDIGGSHESRGFIQSPRRRGRAASAAPRCRAPWQSSD